MNERIQELADRLWRVHPSDIDAMGLKTRTEFYKHELKKFAELIVRECLLCCERTISDPVPKSVDTFEQGGIHCMDEIKQHFGVEE